MLVDVVLGVGRLVLISTVVCCSCAKYRGGAAVSVAMDQDYSHRRFCAENIGLPVSAKNVNC